MFDATICSKCGVPFFSKDVLREDVEEAKRTVRFYRCPNCKRILKAVTYVGPETDRVFLCFDQE